MPTLICLLPFFREDHRTVGNPSIGESIFSIREIVGEVDPSNSGRDISPIYKDSVNRQVIKRARLGFIKNDISRADLSLNHGLRIQPLCSITLPPTASVLDDAILQAHIRGPIPWSQLDPNDQRISKGFPVLALGPSRPSSSGFGLIEFDFYTLKNNLSNETFREEQPSFITVDDTYFTSYDGTFVGGISMHSIGSTRILIRGPVNLSIDHFRDVRPSTSTRGISSLNPSTDRTSITIPLPPLGSIIYAIYAISSDGMNFGHIGYTHDKSNSTISVSYKNLTINYTRANPNNIDERIEETWTSANARTASYDLIYKPIGFCTSPGTNDALRTDIVGINFDPPAALAEDKARDLRINLEGIRAEQNVIYTNLAHLLTGGDTDTLRQDQATFASEQTAIRAELARIDSEATNLEIPSVRPYLTLLPADPGPDDYVRLSGTDFTFPSIITNPAPWVSNRRLIAGSYIRIVIFGYSVPDQAETIAPNANILYKNAPSKGGIVIISASHFMNFAGISIGNTIYLNLFNLNGNIVMGNYTNSATGRSINLMRTIDGVATTLSGTTVNIPVGTAVGKLSPGAGSLVMNLFVPRDSHPVPVALATTT